MKKVKKIVSAITLLFLFITILAGCSKSGEQNISSGKKEVVNATNKGKKLNVIASESKVEWLGKKVTGKENGTVDLKGGELFVDNGKLTGGSFEIDFTKIKSLGLSDSSMTLKLESHLKSDDFFSAQSFPLGKFEITSINPLSNGTQNNTTIGGKLTIKGITKEISFPASLNINGDVVTASADFNIDRTQWDIKFRSGKFYENLGDKLINDDFNIKFNITAK